MAKGDPSGPAARRHELAAELHERAADVHERASDIHEASAELHEDHGEEMIQAGRSDSAQRAFLIAARERASAMEARYKVDDERAKAVSAQRDRAQQDMPEERTPASD
jgi:hypothetical protein